MDEEIDVDVVWLVKIINDVIICYKEKYCFLMMGIEYYDDVCQVFGKEEGDKFIEEFGDFFMSLFICGNVEYLVIIFKEWFVEQGMFYILLLVLYFEKYNEKMEFV